MNFEKIPPVDRYQHFLDLAFRKAREKEQLKDLTGNWLQKIRKKESLKLDVIKDLLVSNLDRILKSFPDLDALPEFYHKLMRLTLEYPEFKKSLGAVNWASKRIRLLQKEYVSEINRAKTREKISEASRGFYGRISSTLKQVDKQLQYLEHCRRIMRTYPDVREMFTVCLYGFPNVGKTTLLNKLAQTKAKVAAYAFTTLSINSGYFTADGSKIQVLDVPGTLARKEKMNLIEMQADLVVKELADVIVFVFDLSESCGYSVKMQEKLLSQLGRHKPVLIYLSKTDLPEGQPAAEFRHKFYSLQQLKENISELAIKKEASAKENNPEILNGVY